ncbi:MAG: aminopeptidase P N-terminal domain-containing protein, partial [Halioglobus sp.]
MSISKTEFARRRKNVMGLMAPNSIAIIPSAREQVRSRDTAYPFRQDSDFYYLSGFTEPDAVLVLLPGRRHGQFILFCRERDPGRELWHGHRAGPEGACQSYQADDAFPIGDIDDILPGLLEGRDRVYYSMGRSAEFDRRIMGWVNRIRTKESSGAVPPGEFTDLDHMLHELRLFKSAAELRLMRRAAEITARAHRRAMQASRSGLYEYQLEAELQHEFTSGGARFPAYPSIVGSGENACVMHYIENSDKLRDGDLVLIDAGCELEHYASDVTRTFPVNGRFSSAQRALYEVVLRAQLAAIAEVKPGNHWNQPHDASVRVFTEGLVALGLLKGSIKSLIK